MIYLIVVSVILITGLVFLLLRIMYTENMGPRQPKHKLIDALKKTAIVLEKYNKPWIIAYGTLLGIMREGNPLEGDDDIDLIIYKKDSNELLQLFDELDEFKVDKSYEKYKNFRRRWYNDIPIDIYLTEEYNKDGYDACDKWERIPFNMLPPKQISWNGVTLNIPEDYEKFLSGVYGDWKTPKHGKNTYPNRKRC